MNARRRPLLLIAEDDPADRELIRRSLSDHSLDIEIVNDGAEIVEYVDKAMRNNPAARRPDLIIVDLNMPKLTGKAVLQHLQNDESASSIPCVVFSSSNREVEVRDCYRAGCSSYVVKPTDLDPFTTALNLIVVYWLHLVELPPA